MISTRKVSVVSFVSWAGIVCMLGYLATSCSSESQLLGGKGGSSNQVIQAANPLTAAGNPAVVGGKSTSHAKPIGGGEQDERELPTIDVAGVNLIGDCLDPELIAEDSKRAFLDCSIKTNSKTPATLQFQSVLLSGIGESETYAPVDITGVATSTTNEYTISSDIPLKLSFEIQQNTLQKLNAQGATIVFSGVVLNKKNIVPNIKTDSRVQKKNSQKFRVTYELLPGSQGTAPVDPKEYSWQDEIEVSRNKVMKNGKENDGWYERGFSDKCLNGSKYALKIKHDTKLYPCWNDLSRGGQGEK